jgi:hypothetical protein
MIRRALKKVLQEIFSFFVVRVLRIDGRCCPDGRSCCNMEDADYGDAHLNQWDLEDGDSKLSQ